MRYTFRHALLALALTIGSSLSVYAIKARPGVVTVKQPDGTTLLVRIHGDENHHYVTTLDGYRIATDQSGTYRYVTMDSKSRKLVLSDVAVHNTESRTRQESARLQNIPKAVELNSNALVTKSVVKSIDRPLSPEVLNPSARGVMNSHRYARKGVGAEPNESQYLCVLVNFKDSRMKFKNEDFDNFLNQSNYAGFGSVKDYFRDNSNRKFVPNFVTVGPYTLSKSVLDYAANDYETGSDIDPRSMVREAALLAKENNPALDFSIFDNDGDGYMDNIYVIYAGYSEASTGNPDDMWPHSWTMGDDDVIVDGIRIHNYSCSQELVGTPGNPKVPTMDGIGTFTHEFGHILGLKDMYDTNDYYNGKGIDPGAYSLYASGSYNNDSKTPAALWAFERLQMGWMELGKDILELKDAEDVTQQNSATTFTARYINCQPERVPENGHELFILENRQFVGWDAYIPGHGLLIYHYDYTKEKQDEWWSINGPNNDSRHRCLYIKCADNIDDDNSRSGDTYPGNTANTSFTDFTTPNALNWAGYATNVPVTNISELNGVVRYQVSGGKTRWNVITTLKPTRILDTQAMMSCQVEQTNGNIAEMGFCWCEGFAEPSVASAHQTVTPGTTASSVISGLKAGTQYSVKAYMKMQDGTVVYGSAINFKTEYPTAYAPFQTDFNQWTNGLIDGWEIIDRNGDGTTWVYDKQSSSICYQFDYWNNADDWLICKRRYHIPENGTLFIQRGVNEQQYVEGLEVYVSTTTSDIDAFYLHKQFTFADKFGMQVYEEVDLSMYAGKDIYIAFRCNSEAMQGLLRLWEVRMDTKLPAPHISYFGTGENDDQLKVQWNHVEGAENYYLYLGKVSGDVYSVTTFTGMDFYKYFSNNVELSSGHIFFQGDGFVELKEIPTGYNDLKFMVYPTGPVGTSFLDIEGTDDGINWIPVCPRVTLSQYVAEGIECNYQQYVKDRGYVKLRFRFTDNGHLAHIRYLTVGYDDGYYWDQLAAGTTTQTEMLINAKTPGEFRLGQFVTWVASGTKDGLFFDESDNAFFSYPRFMSHFNPTGIDDMAQEDNSAISFRDNTIVVSGVAEGTPVTVFNNSGILLQKSTAVAGNVSIPTAGYHGVILVKVGNTTHKILVQ